MTYLGTIVTDTKSRGGSRGGEKGYYPPLSLSLSLSLSVSSHMLSYALDFLLLKLFFSYFLFLLRMTKGDNKKISKLCFYGTSPKEDAGILTIFVTLWYVNSIHNSIENVPQTYQRNIDRYIH